MNSRFEAAAKQTETDFAKVAAVTSAGFAQAESQASALMEKGLREQMRFFLLGWSVLLAAIIGLYAK